MVNKYNKINDVLNSENSKFKTSITKIENNKIITHGYSQEEIIENLQYSDMVYLLLQGVLPSKSESKIFNHILVSFADHGVTPPSTQTARLIASSGSPVNVALAGGLLSFGKYHAGAIEKAMNLFQISLKNNINSSQNVSSDTLNEVAKEITDDCFKNNKKIPGYGHRYHNRDPRALKLVEIAKGENFLGNHTKLALAIEEISLKQKKLHINIDGISGALLSDLGFSPKKGLGIFIIGRIPGLISHILEESNDEVEFRKLLNLEDIFYDGDENKHFHE